MKKFFYVIAAICLLCVIGCSEKNDPATPKTDELTITSINPDNGVAGDYVEILGSGFGSNPANIEVTINSQKLTLTETAPTKLKLQLPYNPVGTYPVKIKVGDKEATGPDFTYNEVVAPTFGPEIGETGTKITIRGAGFSETASENIVKINGKEAEVVSASVNEMIVIAPENDEDTSYPIEVTVNGRTQTSESNFKYGHFEYGSFGEIKAYASASAVAFADEETLIFGTFDGSNVTKVHYMKLNNPETIYGFCAKYDLGSHSQTGYVKMMQPYGDKIYFAYYRDNIIGVCDLKPEELDGTDYSSRQITDLGITGLQAPADIKFDAEGNMYVLGVDNKAVLKFNKGNFTGTGETFVSFDVNIMCMDFDWDGKLIVADRGKNGIYTLYRVDNGTPAAIATFNSEITSMIVDPLKKDIYVACANKNMWLIRKNNPEPSVIAAIDVFYGMKMSPARDGIYAGATYYHNGGILKLLITLEYGNNDGNE